MLTSIRRARHLQRYQQIVSVLARHGFSSALENLQADRYLPISRFFLRQKTPPSTLTRAQHFRQALEELGPTFIKFGQVLSTRPDVVPPDYIVELTKLLDRVPALDWKVVLETLEREYGRNPLDIFTEIDPEPLGSASLSQVHAAVLPGVGDVVIKVQRPHIQQIISADLEILKDLAQMAQRTAWGQVYNPVEIVAQFAFTLTNELDYRKEGLNADRFRANFRDEQHLYIPQVVWEYCTQRVLVLERLRGVRIDDVDQLNAEAFDRKEVAHHAARIIVKEILEDGFFHADPHPGNFLVMHTPALPPSIEGGEDGTGGGAPAEDEVVIGVFDFGMVGTVSQMDRNNLIQAYVLIAKKDAHGLVEHLVRIGAVTNNSDINALERDLDRLISHYQGLSLKYIQVRKFVEDLMQVAFRYRVNLPPDLWLLFKTVAMMEGLARQLDPDFNVLSEFTPQVKRLLVERHLPWVWGPSFMDDFEALAIAMRDLPNMGQGLLRRLQRGELPFSLSVGANKETMDRIDRLITRMSLSLLATAFILGLALLLPVASGNPLAMALVIIGFLVATSLGVWLAVSIIRSGK